MISPNATKRAQIEDLRRQLAAAEAKLTAQESELARAAHLSTASDERFRHLIEQLPDAMGVHRDGHWVYVNPALARLLGYATPSELIGKQAIDAVAPESRVRTLAHTTALLSGQSGHRLRDRHMLKRDGTPITVEAVLVPLQFDGAPALLIHARDVDEQRRMEAQLAQLDRMASLGKISAGIAHELNNPLAYVLANLGYLAEELPKVLPGFASPECETKETRELALTLADACEGAERVGVIVRELMNFSRSSDEEQMTAVDVRAALDAACNLAGADIRRCAILVRDYGEVRKVVCNESRLVQAFLKLVVNAVEAIPPGRPSDHQIRLVCRSEGKNVIVEVHDTGAGIPQTAMARVFDPFFTLKPVGAGAGLGLSTCHQILTAMGGTIALDSKVGSGTVARITLPAPVAGRSVPPPVAMKKSA